MGNLIDIIREELGSRDQVQYLHRVTHEAKEGDLVVTTTQILFIAKSGFFKPDFQMIVKIPYTQLKTISPVGNQRLELETDAHTYHFTSLGHVKAMSIAKEIIALVRACMSDKRMHWVANDAREESALIG